MKSPTFYGKTVEVGPLANMLVKLAAGRESTQNKLNEIVAIYQKLTGNTLEVAQLHSTLGRIIGRTVHCCELQDILQNQYSALITNIGKGDHTTFVKPNIPATGEFKGVGFLEAPRGMLSHWMVIKDGIISNYRAVVPSTGTLARVTSMMTSVLTSSRWWVHRLPIRINRWKWCVPFTPSTRAWPVRYT